MIMKNDRCKQVAFIQLRSVIESLRVTKRFIGRSWYEICKEYNSKSIWFRFISPYGSMMMMKFPFDSGFGESVLKRLSQYSYWDDKSADDIKEVFYSFYNFGEFLKSLI